MMKGVNRVNEIEEKMERLQILVKEGREHFERTGDLDLGYVTGFVIPILKEVLQGICREIEERHKLDEAEGDFVIHYTSIATIVSMLQNASKNKKDVSEDDQESSNDDQNASLRLYDSVHFNDPDEGNYFARHLNLPKRYDWIDKEKKDASHAYIASFIISDNKRDMSDNLVFWRTYGREGEGCSLKLCIPSCRLRKVLYGANEVKRSGQILRSVLAILDPLVNIRKRLLKEKIREKLAEAVWESMERIRYLYKSEAYEYENECRFVVAEPDIPDISDKVCYEYQDRNNSPARIRHYYEDEVLEIKKILPSGSLITLGPCVPHSSDVRYCLESLKRKANMYGPEIKLSEISYRKS